MSRHCSVLKSWRKHDKNRPGMVMNNYCKWCISVCLCLLVAILQSCNKADEVQLKNSDFCLILGYNQNGIPIIKKGYWLRTGITAFSDEQNNFTYDDWLPAALAPARENKNAVSGEAWKISTRDKFIVATASRNLDKLKMTWQIEISHQGVLFNTSVKLSNNGNETLPVAWYPVWLSGWFRSTAENCILESWQPLSYQPQTSRILHEKPLTLHSSVYSSDNHDRTGSVPYCRINNQATRLSFSLADGRPRFISRMIIQMLK